MSPPNLNLLPNRDALPHEEIERQLEQPLVWYLDELVRIIGPDIKELFGIQSDLPLEKSIPPFCDFLDYINDSGAQRLIDKIVDKYIENGKYLDQNLNGIQGVELIKYYDNSEPSYWLYTLKVENRAGFIKMMEANGIAASELHKRNDLHQYLNDNPMELPNLDQFYEKMVHIPCGWCVTKDDCDKMIELIRKGW